MRGMIPPSTYAGQLQEGDTPRAETGSSCMPILATASVASGLGLVIVTIAALLSPEETEDNQALYGVGIAAAVVAWAIAVLATWAFSSTYLRNNSSESSPSEASLLIDYRRALTVSEDSMEAVPAFPDDKMLRSSDDEPSPADATAAEEAGEESDGLIFGDLDSDSDSESKSKFTLGPGLRR